MAADTKKNKDREGDSSDEGKGNKKATKTLNLKGISKTKIITTPNRGGPNLENESPEIKCHFATERINLPRGKVIRNSSRSSSAYGSKRGSQSPVKLPRNILIQEKEPNY